MIWIGGNFFSPGTWMLDPRDCAPIRGTFLALLLPPRALARSRVVLPRNARAELPTTLGARGPGHLLAPSTEIQITPY